MLSTLRVPVLASGRTRAREAFAVRERPLLQVPIATGIAVESVPGIEFQQRKPHTSDCSRQTRVITKRTHVWEGQLHALGDLRKYSEVR